MSIRWQSLKKSKTGRDPVGAFALAQFGKKTAQHGGTIGFENSGYKLNAMVKPRVVG